MSYVPYHLHTMYSVADGIASSEQYVKRASELNIKALGITDHGNCFGWVNHTKACLEKGIKPIIGTEAYIYDEEDGDKDKSGHAVIIILDKEGYDNLLYLIQDSYNHFYHHARISAKQLLKHNQGLLVTTACIGGIFNKLLHNKEDASKINQDEATKRFNTWYEVFGDRLKGEIQPAYNEEQKTCNNWVRATFSDDNIWCATDSHYVMPSDNIFQGTVKYMISESYKGYEDYYYLWPYEELIAYDGILQRYVDNTNWLIDNVKFQLKLDTPRMPDVSLPMGRNNHMLPNTYDSYLYELAFKGLNNRRPQHTYEYVKRLLYELKVMKDNHTAPYLLMNYQIFKRLREQGIVYGPRGSACGSLVAYCLFLHDIDPLEQNIMFERFMTPGRKSLPDIDYDFYTPDRELAFATLKDMYGEDSVSRIVTFNRLRLKSALLKIGKRYEISKDDITLCSEGVKYSADDADTSYGQLRKALYKKYGVDKLEELKYKDGNYTQWLSDVERICELNLPISQGIHACGCVVTSRDKPINQIWPVLYKDGDMAVQYDMEDIEAAGGVKIDFLGLSSLYPINTMLRLLELKAAHIPLDDPEVYKFIQHDSMFGLFQAKNFNMKKLIRDIQPVQLSDLALAIAAFRPAVLNEGLQDRYVNRKNGKEPIEYPHPDLEPVLKGTYGVFIYQDHILGACKAIGMSDLEADKVRKATAKKKPEEVKKLYKLFSDRAREKGWDGITIDRVWSIIESAAGYGFNFSHALSYARWLYISAWIKLYYPEIFFTASLTARQGAGQKEDEGVLFIELLKDCRKYAPQDASIVLLPPSINNSSHEFTYNWFDNSITFSIAAVKNINADIALWLRKYGPFTSLEHLIETAENTKVMIDTLEPPESKLLKVITKAAKNKSKLKLLKVVKGKGGVKEIAIADKAVINSHALLDVYVSGLLSMYMSYSNLFGTYGYLMVNHTRYKQIVSFNHIESLIKAGALDEIGDRRRMLEAMFFHRVSEKKDALLLTAKERSAFKQALDKLGWTQEYFIKYYDEDQVVQTTPLDKEQNTILKTASKKYAKYRKQYEGDLDGIRFSYCGYKSCDYGGDSFMEVDYFQTLTVHGIIKNYALDKETNTGSYFHTFTIDTSSGEIKCMVWEQYTEALREFIDTGKKVAVTGRKKKDKFNTGRQMMDAYSMRELEGY